MSFKGNETYLKGLNSEINNVQRWLAQILGKDRLTSMEFASYERDLELLSDQVRPLWVKTPDRNIRQWLEVCAPKHFGWFTSILYGFDRKLVHASTRTPDLEKIEDLQSTLEDLTITIKSLWRGDEAPGPERFKYEGFQILNPDRLSDWVTRQLLDSVDYLKAKFKKRGLEEVLYDGLTDITLSLDTEGSYHGLYDPNHKRIVMIARKVRNHNETRLGTNRWVDEVFMHEFGHHVHMSYVTGEARKFWDGTWAPVVDAEKQDRDAYKVTYQDRLRFWKFLEKARFDIAVVRRKLKSPDKEKFLGWMLRARFIKLGKDGSRVGLTPEGKEFQALFKDPDEYVRTTLINRGNGLTSEDLEWVRDDYVNQAKKDLFLIRENFTLNLMSDPSTRPMALLLQTSLADSAKAQVTEQWGTPSEYGKMNVLEDFAESFVQYIETPERMTENGLYRMKRTLWLSGFGGKPVQRVAARYLAEHKGR